MNKFLMSLLMVPFFSGSAFAHGNESRVEIELESPSTVKAGTIIASFQLVDSKEKKVITPTELNISHEKKLHFMAYDSALKEFRHVHPEFDGKVWTVELDLRVNGKYFIWAQGELASGAEEFSAPGEITISGGEEAWPTPPALGNIRQGSYSGSIASLSNQKLLAGKMTMLTLKFSRADGSAPQITPYLGAFAHVIATPEDGDSLLHVHPMNGSSPNDGMLHVTFPEAGKYRIWVQFMDGGVLKTVSLSVTVTK